MSFEYTVTYKAENNYENFVDDATWQFLIVPETNDTQKLIRVDFENSLNAKFEYSINGLGFQTIRVSPKQNFKHIDFKGSFKLIKKNLNPFEQIPVFNIVENYKELETLGFRVDFEPYLRNTSYTSLPKSSGSIFKFDPKESIFENLQQLNHWVYLYIHFKTGVTTVDTKLEEVLKNKVGVCQDFTHLFCALARDNSIPTRYVSGYLNQGIGFSGDSQMHAWAECYIPEAGWIGFDPTNNLLVSDNHIKVAHGKDYNDCSPLKGIVYALGKNDTVHSVEVQSQQ
ncbi:transglutaminase-like domain-containing protein [Sediminicola arcticus]|jgi:transglutaminase/protease-like cytokinesis protein 3|uniref:Transglutaminase family protein n=1 Tax=Sediminicola arcticus TaxID=1574308 RepID=A0ABV2STG7_9FLAO